MFQLSIEAALAFVRKAMDELTSVEDKGVLADPDALDLQKLVEGSIVEAVVKTHSQAPAYLLDGKSAGAVSNIHVSDKVMHIRFETEVLRVISVKAGDSNVVVTEFIPEDSAEGRKQLNRYVRGVPDDPRVVVIQVWEEGNHRPQLRYYTTEEGDEASADIKYIPYPKIIDGSVNSDNPESEYPATGIAEGDEPTLTPIEKTPVVEICPRLEYAVLNELTAMVLDILNEHDKASLYRAKSKEYMEV